MELDGKRMRAHVVEPLVGWAKASLLLCAGSVPCGQCKRCDSRALDRRQHEEEQKATRLVAVSTKVRLEETRRKLQELHQEPSSSGSSGLPTTDPSVVTVPSGSPNSPFIVTGVSDVKLSKDVAYDSTLVGTLAAGSVCRVDSFLEIDGKRMRAHVVEPKQGWCTAKLLVCRDWGCGSCRNCQGEKRRVVTTSEESAALQGNETASLQRKMEQIQNKISAMNASKIQRQEPGNTELGPGAAPEQAPRRGGLAASPPSQRKVFNHDAIRTGGSSGSKERLFANFASLVTVDGAGREDWLPEWFPGKEVPPSSFRAQLLQSTLAASGSSIQAEREPRKKARQLAMRMIRIVIRSVVGREESYLVKRFVSIWGARAYQFRLCQEPQNSLEATLVGRVRELEMKLSRVVAYVTGTPMAVGLGLPELLEEGSFPVSPGAVFGLTELMGEEEEKGHGGGNDEEEALAAASSHAKPLVDADGNLRGDWARSTTL